MAGLASTPDLSGQHVLVIGGSSGAGFAIAMQAKADGARLTLAARDPGRLQSAARRLGVSETRTIDLRQAETIAASLAGLGEIDHLVTSAGTLSVAPIAGSAPEDWRLILEERIIGPLAVIKTLLPQLKRAIVLFSGTVAHRPNAGAALLAAGVAGVESLVRALALELSPLRVNAVAPGLLETEMLDAFLGDAKADVVAHMVSKLPVQRAGTADDAAAAAIYLIKNSYSTGTVIAVDGGSLLI